jgi:hypothetical protein
MTAHNLLVTREGFMTAYNLPVTQEGFMIAHNLPVIQEGYHDRSQFAGNTKDIMTALTICSLHKKDIMTAHNLPVTQKVNKDH